MSIKNIIQQENDLQEMSQQSLANYLNNPTGQYNPYLVAGELQRKEQFAQRQMVEAPQETVVDELVQKTMPMGGMPRSGMPMGGMPMPRPQETMVSDTITETGIASLPAPNVGQNYAEGGIIGYEEGGEVEEIEDYTAMEMLTEMAQEPDLVAEVGGSALLKAAGVASPYIKGAGLGALFYSPELGSAEDPNFLAKMQGQQNFAKGGQVQKFALGGLTLIPRIAPFLSKNYKKIKDVYNKFTKKKTATPPATPKATPKTKPKATAKPKSKPGAVDRAILGGAGKVADLGVTGLARGITGAVRNPYTTAGLLGLGGYFKNQYDEGQEERERIQADEEASKIERRAIIAADKKARAANVQAQLDADKAARDRRREKEMYLALALGGAKTMAGQSPFALTNIGEGLGSGIGALAAYDQNEMERMAASQAATIKANAALSEQLRSEQLEYGELRLKVKESDDYIAFEKQVRKDLDEGNIATLEEANRKLEDYILDTLGMVAPQQREYQDSKGQIFYAAE